MHKKGGDRDTQQDIAGGVAGGSPLRWGGRAPNVGGRLQRAGRLPLTYLHWVGPGHAVGDGPALALIQSWGRRRPREHLLSGLVLAVRGTGGPDELAQRRLREGGKQHLPTGISIRETSGGESRAKKEDGKGEKGWRRKQIEAGSVKRNARRRKREGGAEKRGERGEKCAERG